MENKNLSPKALSKPIHKVSSWITPSLKKELDKFFHESKKSLAFKTKSEIISESIERMYFSEPFTKLPKSIFSEESPTSRITFYLSPEIIQHFWDIEGHYLGEGIKISPSLIIRLALEDYLDL